MKAPRKIHLKGRERQFRTGAVFMPTPGKSTQFNADQLALMAQVIREAGTMVSSDHALHQFAGYLNVGLHALYTDAEDQVRVEVRWDDRSTGERSYQFRSRGLGVEHSLHCFVCGTNDPPRSVRNNLAAFVRSREEGKQIIDLLFFKLDGTGAWLDYRASEPNRIQVKVGACDEHLPNLRRLHDLVSVHGVIRAGMVKDARIFPAVD